MVEVLGVAVVGVVVGGITAWDEEGTCGGAGGGATEVVVVLVEEPLRIAGPDAGSMQGSGGRSEE